MPDNVRRGSLNQKRDSNHHAQGKVGGMSLDLTQMSVPAQQRHGSSAKHGGNVGRSHDKGGFFTQAQDGTSAQEFLNKTQQIQFGGADNASKANANNERANRINLHRSNR